MNIWIDITNSPHVNFFAYMIKDISKYHNIILTARPLANTIDLLELYKFKYFLIGKHYGKNLLKKSLGYLIRIWQLFTFLKNMNIDVAISHSSFYSPVVAKLLRAKCLYLNDNEFAKGNWLAFIFADKILIPEFLNENLIHIHRNRIIKYPGVKEGIYLWHLPFSCTMNKETIKKRVFFRPEPWTAQYYKGKKYCFDELLLQLADLYDVFILPRNKDQLEHYKQNKFSKLYVLESSVSLQDIMKNCDLFIGAGGTMTREAAVLGIPTISIYQDKLLQVDKFLINEGFMAFSKYPNLKFITDFIDNAKINAPNQSLLDKGKQAYNLIKNTLLNA